MTYVGGSVLSIKAHLIQNTKINFEKGKLMFNQACETNTSNETSMYIHAYG